MNAEGARRLLEETGEGWLADPQCNAGELDLPLGELHDGLEVARPSLAKAAFEREKTR